MAHEQLPVIFAAFLSLTVLHFPLWMFLCHPLPHLLQGEGEGWWNGVRGQLGIAS